MPRQPRSTAEIDAVRQRILDESLDLFAEVGWDSFSMRKLGSRLGIAAKTVYNYFESKDELYLRLLTHGFHTLHAELVAATADETDPWQRLDAIVERYVVFAFQHPHLYQLMFTWHVPKYDDYVGTPLHDVAALELETALASQHLLAASIARCAQAPVSDDDLRFASIRVWTQVHGYVSGVISTIVGYLHPDPSQIHQRMVRRLQDAAREEVAALAVPAHADH